MASTDTYVAFMDAAATVAEQFDCTVMKVLATRHDRLIRRCKTEQQRDALNELLRTLGDYIPHSRARTAAASDLLNSKIMTKGAP